MANTVPTKANLMAMQKSLSLAKLGYELMDRKKNILVREMMQLIDEAKEVESGINEVYRKAYASLRMANITLGLCSDYARCVPLDLSVNVDYRSVMGVEIPVVTGGETEFKNHYGFDSTNSYLDEAYFNFNEAKKMTLRLAETQNAIFRLADAVKKTQKRANALGNIMIPHFTEQIKFISDALEEKDREDFTRLKVVKRIKEENTKKD